MVEKIYNIWLILYLTQGAFKDTTSGFGDHDGMILIPSLIPMCFSVTISTLDILITGIYFFVVLRVQERGGYPESFFRYTPDVTLPSVNVRSFSREWSLAYPSWKQNLKDRRPWYSLFKETNSVGQISCQLGTFWPLNPLGCGFCVIF